MMTTRQNLIKSVRAQVGSNLIVACSLLLSFLSVWIKMLKLSGMHVGKLQTSMKITMELISTLERANERFARRQKENAKQFSKQRSKSMFRQTNHLPLYHEYIKYSIFLFSYIYSPLKTQIKATTLFHYFVMTLWKTD